MKRIQYDMHNCHCDRAPDVEELSKVPKSHEIPKQSLSVHVDYLVDRRVNEADQKQECYVVLFESFGLIVVEIVMDVNMIDVVEEEAHLACMEH